MKKITLLCLLLAGMLLVSNRAYAEGPIFKFWAAEDSCIIGPSAAYNSNNYNYLNYLRVRDRDYDDSVSKSNQVTCRTLIKFSDADLATLSGLDIVSASLYLYEYERFRDIPGADTIELFGVTGVWDEVAVTWNTQPTYEETSSASRIFDEANNSPGWKSWESSEFTTLVEDWVTGAEDNNGLMLQDDFDDTFNEIDIFFHRREHLGGTSIYRPYLEITATPEPFSAVLFGIGAGFLGILKVRRRRRKG
jgi:hypothetical protein